MCFSVHGPGRDQPEDGVTSSLPARDSRRPTCVWNVACCMKYGLSMVTLEAHDTCTVPAHQVAAALRCVLRTCPCLVEAAFLHMAQDTQRVLWPSWRGCMSLLAFGTGNAQMQHYHEWINNVPALETWDLISNLFGFLVRGQEYRCRAGPWQLTACSKPVRGYWP